MKASPENESDLIARLSAEREITRLIATYCHLLDSGKFDAVARLLQHATFDVSGSTVEGQAAIAQYLDAGIQRHDDGTPRTWHVVSNILIDVDLEQDSATSTSYFTVHQELSGLPLQAICTGHYRDSFARHEGGWRFVRRAVSAHLIGNLAFHVASQDRAS